MSLHGQPQYGQNSEEYCISKAALQLGHGTGNAQDRTKNQLHTDTWIHISIKKAEQQQHVERIATWEQTSQQRQGIPCGLAPQEDGPLRTRISSARHTHHKRGKIRLIDLIAISIRISCNRQTLRQLPGMANHCACGPEHRIQNANVQLTARINFFFCCGAAVCFEVRVRRLPAVHATAVELRPLFMRKAR